MIHIKPPLPCFVGKSVEGGCSSDQDINSGLWSGWVRGLGDEFLEILPADPTSLSERSGDSVTVNISFDGNRRYQISAWPVETAPGAAALIFRTADKEILGDLLTLVRKNQHISLCATVDVEAKDRYTGFADIVMRPKALPELDWQDLDISTQFLGRSFAAPLLITGMTGGLERGAEINRNLALAAEALGIPMGVGSQRVALDNPAHGPIFDVKKYAPNLFLIGNLGIAQIAHRTAAEVVDLGKRAVGMIEADALAIHANVLQELVQVEGDRNFRGVLTSLEALVKGLEVPVILKEVGVGVDRDTAQRLANIGVAAIDVGGKGGTSWSYIEGLRTGEDSVRSLAESFRDWGIPTAFALFELLNGHKVSPLNKIFDIPIIATGGIRDGLMVAKAVGLGARLCGIGLPLLKAALCSSEDVTYALNSFVHGLKTAMLGTGVSRLGDLPSALRLTHNFIQLAETWSDQPSHSIRGIKAPQIASFQETSAP